MPNVVNVENKIVFRDKIKKFVSSNEVKVLLLDGKPSSGKTSFAEALSSSYTIPFIKLDEFVFESDNLYKVNYPCLKVVINNKLKKAKKMIIDGVLAKEHSEKIGLKDYLWIYMRNSYSEERMNDKLCDESDPSHPLYKQISNYEKNYAPLDNADIIIKSNSSELKEKYFDFL